MKHDSIFMKAINFYVKTLFDSNVSNRLRHTDCLFDFETHSKFLKGHILCVLSVYQEKSRCIKKRQMQGVAMLNFWRGSEIS